MNSDTPKHISIQCGKCGKQLRGPSSAVGRKVKCPKCGAIARLGDKQPPSRPSGRPGAESAAASTNRAANTVKKSLVTEGSAEPAIAPSESSPEIGLDTPVAGGLMDLDDPFTLSDPAIDNLEGRKQESDDVRAEKDKKRELVRRKRAQNKEPLEPTKGLSAIEPISAKQTPESETIPFDGWENKEEVAASEKKPTAGSAGSASPKQNSAHRVRSHSGAKASSANSGSSGSGKRGEPSRKHRADSETDKPSIFDGDLDVDQLELEALDEVRKSPKVTAGLPNADQDLSDLDDLVPQLDGLADLPPLIEEEVTESTYRVECKTCGTAQYVSTSATGAMIKCPDCFLQFRVPPPPPGWKPKKRKKLPSSASIADDPGFQLAATEIDSSAEDAQRRGRTQAMLDRAKNELTVEEEDQLYESDFDTAGFVQGTFGFLRDPITISQVFIFGFVFAAAFGTMRIALNDTDSFFGRGLVLIVCIMVPVLSILFALPMLSGGLALIESVANKQRFVKDLPAFNIFDNFGDMLVIAAALGLAIVPGFILGISFVEPETRMLAGLSGMLISSFLFFPVFLLSMLDNGSLFAPLSRSVLQSFYKGTEAWGGYYLKTLVAVGCILILWVILLSGNSPIRASFAGFFVPLILFFTCQQIGTLADKIGDHLSFEFVPPDKDEVEGSDSDPSAREHVVEMD